MAKREAHEIRPSPHEQGREEGADDRANPRSTVVPPHVYDDLVAALGAPPEELPRLAAAARRATRIIAP